MHGRYFDTKSSYHCPYHTTKLKFLYETELLISVYHVLVWRFQETFPVRHIPSNFTFSKIYVNAQLMDFEPTSTIALENIFHQNRFPR